MRKILLLPTIALLTLLLVNCGASRKFDYRNSYTHEVLDGIFKIRLGMSESELRAIVDTTLLKDYAYPKNKVLDMVSSNLVPFPRVRELELEQYTPSLGYTLEDIRLKFFDDKLYSIEIRNYNPDLERQLSLKYGESKSKIVRGTEIEYKTYAERTKRSDSIKSKKNYTNFYDQWRTNDKDIICKSEFVNGYLLELRNKAVPLEIKQAIEDFSEERRKDQEYKRKIRDQQLLDEL